MAWKSSRFDIQKVTRYVLVHGCSTEDGAHRVSDAAEFRRRDQAEAALAALNAAHGNGPARVERLVDAAIQVADDLGREMAKASSSMDSREIGADSPGDASPDAAVDRFIGLLRAHLEANPGTVAWPVPPRVWTAESIGADVLYSVRGRLAVVPA